MSSMISLWITIGLVIAGTLVSTLGAYFSIIGLGALFSGAVVAVWLMAGSLEFAKFILAAYLHQTWQKLNIAFKIYLTSSVIILSSITSIGVFGFLSDAYQSASHSLEEQTLKLETLKKQNDLYTSEIERLNYSVEEIPEDRVSRRLQARALAEPKILELNKKIEENEKQISNTNMAILDVKKKVGPLIFIAKSLKVDIDTVVRYLIIIFVTVFDPLAICLVIASTYAIESRSSLNKKRHEMHIKKMQLQLSQELAKEILAEKELEKEIRKQSAIAESNIVPESQDIKIEEPIKEASIYPSAVPLSDVKVNDILESVNSTNEIETPVENSVIVNEQIDSNSFQAVAENNPVIFKESNVIPLNAEVNKLEIAAEINQNPLIINEDLKVDQNLNLEIEKQPEAEEISSDDVVVQMNFKDPKNKKSS